MEVILLERVAKLGQMGEVVNVKDGYARNYLLPQKKALRANDANRKAYEAQKAHLEARNLETRKEAEQLAARLNGQRFVIIRSASDAGALYGSVTTRDAAKPRLRPASRSIASKFNCCARSRNLACTPSVWCCTPR